RRCERRLPTLLSVQRMHSGSRGGEAGPPDADGWVELTVPSESWDVLVTGLLPLGEFAEVLEPPHVRARFAATAAGMHALYG
uniref:WYL domain-containing protein n=1 Tax=Nocardia cyriacigeorgica TaxID=135487 RepID=UPI002457BB97